MFILFQLKFFIFRSNIWTCGGYSFYSNYQSIFVRDMPRNSINKQVPVTNKQVGWRHQFVSCLFSRGNPTWAHRCRPCILSLSFHEFLCNAFILLRKTTTLKEYKESTERVIFLTWKSTADIDCLNLQNKKTS